MSFKDILLCAIFFYFLGSTITLLYVFNNLENKKDNILFIKKCISYNPTSGKCIKAIGENNETIMFVQFRKDRI